MKTKRRFLVALLCGGSLVFTVCAATIQLLRSLQTSNYAMLEEVHRLTLHLHRYHRSQYRLRYLLCSVPVLGRWIQSPPTLQLRTCGDKNPSVICQFTSMLSRVPILGDLVTRGLRVHQLHHLQDLTSSRNLNLTSTKYPQWATFTQDWLVFLGYCLGALVLLPFVVLSLAIILQIIVTIELAILAWLTVQSKKEEKDEEKEEKKKEEEPSDQQQQQQQEDDGQQKKKPSDDRPHDDHRRSWTSSSDADSDSSSSSDSETDSWSSSDDDCSCDSSHSVEPDLTEVYPGLWVGKVDNLTVPELLKRNIRMVMIAEKDNNLPLNHPQVQVIPAYVEDRNFAPISNYFPTAVKSFYEAKKSGFGFACVCAMGINRSATLALAAMVGNKTMTLREAFFTIKEERHVIFPINDFMHQLILYEKLVLGSASVRLVYDRETDKYYPDVYYPRLW